jgi:hypothetical protein
MAIKEDCMSRLIRIVTAAMFTAHIMMGCCIHHAHASEGQKQTIPVQGTVAQNCQCPDDHGSQTEHSKHGSQGCTGEKCSFVHTNFKAGNSLVQSFRMFVTPLFQELSPPDVMAKQQHSIATGLLLTPIHLHLANQVLLI